MLTMRNFNQKGVRGFSLIEMMVAIVAGMIVIGSVLAFTVSMLRSYNENIRSTRLTQDLRTTIGLAVREARRAGYDRSSVQRVMTDNIPVPNLGALAVSSTGNCFTYQYDRGNAVASRQNRAIRWNSTAGTLQMKTADSAVTCTDASGWEDVSDPAVVNITGFKVVERKSPFCVDINKTKDPVTGADVYLRAEGLVRNLSFCVRGALRSDATIIRSIADSGRTRAEVVNFLKNQAAACPTTHAAPDAMKTSAELIADCGVSP
ncbi:hypothetical protein N800_10015 [Lysobacter daejeonensis GH1-9]|uniref:Pilus assembly protein PilW n=1 Tax=Lysobacter daejeonensis GH1-9 TaxID=1385517 RepID=A0A0A0EYD9_9GAMM|nr:prepilin-type N-terminal cleavage/methylation domain-containing protein [Lysobacter daejeonensis]KGM55961.1 hypothetical protein N800_10015 [Lysobacter daejeonensis GH1-9]